MSVCKWCGAVQIGDDSHLYQCGSWTSANTSVVQSSTCQVRCLQLRLQHEETIDLLHARLADALAALETITRHEIEADFEFDLISERNEHGNWVQWDDVETILEILTGKDSQEQESEQ